MLCTILYPENSDKTRSAELKKHAKNKYILNKAVYPRTVSMVQILFLNHQRIGPAQDFPYALILWYVPKTIYLS